MFTLPLTNRRVRVRPLTGADQVFLLESRGAETETAVGLLARVVEDSAGAFDAAELPVTDFEALILELRRVTQGDFLRTDVDCPAGCTARIEVTFRVSDYLRHVQPKRGAEVEEDTEQGWFRLRGTGGRLRLPTAADQLAVSGADNPESALLARCAAVPARSRMLARVVRAMERMAPTLCQELLGTCPECGATVRMFFDVQRFVLTELRNQAAFVFDDVDRIASRYHWSEREILELPARRRMAYADRAAQAGRMG